MLRERERNAPWGCVMHVPVLLPRHTCCGGGAAFFLCLWCARVAASPQVPRGCLTSPASSGNRLTKTPFCIAIAWAPGSCATQLSIPTDLTGNVQCGKCTTVFPAGAPAHAQQQPPPPAYTEYDGHGAAKSKGLNPPQGYPQQAAAPAYNPFPAKGQQRAQQPAQQPQMNQVLMAPQQVGQNK